MNSITFISGWTPPSIIEIIGLLFLAHYLVYVPLRFLFGYLGSTVFSKAGRILKPKLGDWAVVSESKSLVTCIFNCSPKLAF